MSSNGKGQNTSIKSSDSPTHDALNMNDLTRIVNEQAAIISTQRARLLMLEQKNQFLSKAFQSHKLSSEIGAYEKMDRFDVSNSLPHSPLRKPDRQRHREQREKIFASHDDWNEYCADFEKFQKSNCGGGGSEGFSSKSKTFRRSGYD